MSSDAADRLLLRLAVLTLTLLFLTILAGTVVRATGSGMGCPDWPRCFGRLIPPTDISQLPVDYKTRYQVQGKPIADFNPVHTWVEYINRLAGATAGLAMLATALAAWRVRRRDRLLPVLLTAALGVFGFVAWMGRIVVKTDLEPLNITIHMLGALLLVAAAVTAVQRVQRRTGITPVQRLKRGQKALLWAGLASLLVQIVLGTQVRERVDHVSEVMEDCCRDRWTEQIGPLLRWHQASAWVLCLLLIGSFFALRAAPGGLTPGFKKLRAALLLLPAGSYAAGVSLVLFHFPPALQPVHLVLAALLFGVLTAMLSGSFAEKSP